LKSRIRLQLSRAAPRSGVGLNDRIDSGMGAFPRGCILLPARHGLIRQSRNRCFRMDRVVVTLLRGRLDFKPAGGGWRRWGGILAWRGAGTSPAVRRDIAFCCVSGEVGSNHRVRRSVIGGARGERRVGQFNQRGRLRTRMCARRKGRPRRATRWSGRSRESRSRRRRVGTDFNVEQAGVIPGPRRRSGRGRSENPRCPDPQLPPAFRSDSRVRECGIEPAAGRLYVPLQTSHGWRVE
jgi:hypothetical protein